MNEPWAGSGYPAGPATATPGQAATVDRAVKEWLDRRTATALATAPGIDDREQGKHQGIDDLRQRLDDYWYTLTPAILDAIAAQQQPAPGDAQLRMALAFIEQARDGAYGDLATIDAEQSLREIADAAPAQPAPELAAAMAKVAQSHERALYAAWIDVTHGDPNDAATILAEQLDGYDGPQWDGKETGMEWLERTQGAS